VNDVEPFAKFRVPLPLTSFRLDSSGAPLTTSTDPRYEFVSSEPRIAWPALSVVAITAPFHFPFNMHSNAESGTGSVGYAVSMVAQTQATTDSWSPVAVIGDSTYTVPGSTGGLAGSIPLSVTTTKTLFEGTVFSRQSNGPVTNGYSGFVTITGSGHADEVYIWDLWVLISAGDPAQGP